MVNVKLKKIVFALAASLALFSTTALAKEGPDQKQILKELADRAAGSQAILDAIQSGASPEEVQEMLDGLQPVDCAGLGLSAPGGGKDASMTGSMGILTRPDSGSVAEELARLQMELAQSSKDNAGSYMKEIQRLQSEQKQAGNFLNRARQLQKQAETTRKGAPMPEDMKYYLDTNKLSYPKGGAGQLYSADQWKTVADSLDGFITKMGTEVQKLMVNIQNFVGDYNSYTKGASSSMQSYTKGQSLFSEQGEGVSTAPIATSVILGVLIGMFIMWGIMKKKSRGDKTGERS